VFDEMLEVLYLINIFVLIGL